MYEQFLKFSLKLDDVYLYFLCEKISVILGVNTTRTLYIKNVPKQKYLIVG